MIEFIFEDFSITTAEEERNYFTGQPEPPSQPNPNAIVPPGTYRIIDGELYLISRGSHAIEKSTDKDNAVGLAII